MAININKLRNNIKEAKNDYIENLVKENKQVAMSYRNCTDIVLTGYAMETAYHAIDDMGKDRPLEDKTLYKKSANSRKDEYGRTEIMGENGIYYSYNTIDPITGKQMPKDHGISLKELNGLGHRFFGILCNGSYKNYKDICNGPENVITAHNRVNTIKGARKPKDCRNLSDKTITAYDKIIDNAKKSIFSAKGFMTNTMISLTFNKVINNACIEMTEGIIDYIGEVMLQNQILDYKEVMNKVCKSNYVRRIYNKFKLSIQDLVKDIPTFRDLTKMLKDTIINCIGSLFRQGISMIKNTGKIIKLTSKTLRSIFTVDTKIRHDNEKDIFLEIAAMSFDYLMLALVELKGAVNFVYCLLTQLVDIVLKVSIFVYRTYIDITDKYYANEERFHDIIMSI